MLDFLITTLWITGFALVLFPSAPTLSLPSPTRCPLFALRRRCCTIKVSHVTASGRQPCRYYQIPLFHLHASLNEERIHFAQLAIHEIAAAATKNRPDTRLRVNSEEDDDANNECCIQLLIFVACCLSWRLFFLQDVSINKPRLAPNRRLLPPHVRLLCEWLTKELSTNDRCNNKNPLSSTHPVSLPYQLFRPPLSTAIRPLSPLQICLQSLHFCTTVSK